MPDHKTVTLVHGYSVEIDAKLAPLIRLLWDNGIDTCQCCEEERPGLACIEFPGTGELCKFLDVAQREYKVEVETWDEGESGRHSFRARLLVFFPTEDIPRLVKEFRTFSEAKEE